MPRRNQYPQACAICGTTVDSDMGYLALSAIGRWSTLHVVCYEEALTPAGTTPVWRSRVARAQNPIADLPDEPDEPAEPATPRVPARDLLPVTLDEAQAKAEALAPLPDLKEAVTLAQQMERAIAESVDSIATTVAQSFNDTVPSMVAALLQSARPITITVAQAEPVKFDRAHAMLPSILMALTAGASPFLVGPAGSGKTTLASQCAKALQRKFYMAARVTSEFKLTGFISATGDYVRTQFREAYEHGGVFLFDEVDASDPDAMTTFNAALANGFADFPDGMVDRHPDFCAIAAGNTFGRGADRQYVGRNQLDAATLDRFQTFEVDYDEQLEIQLAGNDDWTRYVRQCRETADRLKLRVVISPRASIMGAKLLAAGMPRRLVEQACIWKGLDEAQVIRVRSAMGGSL